MIFLDIKICFHPLFLFYLDSVQENGNTKCLKQGSALGSGRPEPDRAQPVFRAWAGSYRANRARAGRLLTEV